MMNQPTLHKPVPIGSRVKIPDYFDKDKTPRFGRVAGISSVHVIFSYIVILDKPLQTEFGLVDAIIVNGPELKSEDGMSDWKL